MTADKDNPAVGEKVTITVSWGHGLAKKQEMKEGVIEKVSVIGPDGKEITPQKIDLIHYSFVPKKAGYYVISAGMHSGFMTKTTTGRKRQSKKGLDNALSCMNFDIRSKMVIRAGKEKSSAASTVGAPIEIVPLGDVSSLKKGDSLEVVIMFKGKPAAGMTVAADHEGFSGKSHDEHSVSARTDASGKVRLKLSKPGVWLIQVKNELPYPDLEVCDTYMYATSLSLTVQ
jgi:uncharacterized GH25 family protein